ncbi:MAG: hypothetical protein DWQ44_13495 [Bacteroidetes bacterium]|nr:MAG: hypothetical protein DWQ33_08305 [Bacteroidota bacterium]REK05724.1 MAG: hypothetical protein DWQ39_04750 [Bacteroidota bacterium]REK31970.1 MAG: hypothetical protein DWQ44_13495 [Bacteroidota bacterium]REK50035.1 MAG: hypothetical protein DWQ48_05720 [Bacteroidota bacterium]
MKRLLHRILNSDLLCLALILQLIFISGCTKNNVEEIKTDNPVIAIDYRDNFAGSYSGVKLCTFWTLSQPGIDTTFYGSFMLNVNKDPLYQNKIIIGNDTISIDSSGSYNGYNNPPAYRNYSITFRNDSVFLSTYSGGLGGGYTCSFSGKK